MESFLKSRIEFWAMNFILFKQEWWRGLEASIILGDFEKTEGESYTFP